MSVITENVFNWKQAMPDLMTIPDTARLVVFKTGIGWVGFLQAEETLLRAKIGFLSERAAFEAFHEFEVESRRPNRWESDLSGRVKKMFDRAKPVKDRAQIDLSDFAIDDDWMTPFQRKVIRACRKIKFGQTNSYGELAEKVGHDGAARAVGSVMSGNRYPIIVPCHRVLSASGIGGFSSPRGLNTKRELLGLEGHAVYADAN